MFMRASVRSLVVIALVALLVAPAAVASSGHYEKVRKVRDASTWEISPCSSEYVEATGPLRVGVTETLLPSGREHVELGFWIQLSNETYSVTAAEEMTFDVIADEYRFPALVSWISDDGLVSWESRYRVVVPMADGEPIGAWAQGDVRSRCTS